ncbi:nuclear transport factor 2 family protein [Streptomyces sp. NPDC052701]|uniref:nuclear transport factor 2 family protein n=1 Tax=Streptomyces sp. NPDC052701 TaxID=3155533 RepID=UPI00341E0C71
MRHRIIVPLALTAALLTACSSGTDEESSGNEEVRVSAAPSGASDTSETSGTSGDTGRQAGGSSRSGKPANNPVAQRYVDAVADEDVAALAAAFHEDAVLNEPGRTFQGRDAIREWAAAEVIGGRLTVLDDTPKRDGTTLLLRFAHRGESGDGFRARYEFTERDGLIGRLDLEYA